MSACHAADCGRSDDGRWQLRTPARRDAGGRALPALVDPVCRREKGGLICHCDAPHASMSWTRSEAEARDSRGRDSRTAAGPPPLSSCAVPSWLGEVHLQRRNVAFGGARGSEAVRAPRRVVTGEESGRTSGLGGDETRHGEIVGAEGVEAEKREGLRGRRAAAWPRSKGRPWPERRPPESFANKTLFWIAVINGDLIFYRPLDIYT
jgi:hypothetical protein